MKCEHGNEVIVNIIWEDRTTYDEGITTFLDDGMTRQSGGTIYPKNYLQVIGCNMCPSIECIGVL